MSNIISSAYGGCKRDKRNAHSLSLYNLSIEATYRNQTLCILGLQIKNSSYCHTSTLVKSDRMKKE